jgi:flagellar P-ring protein FlgI
MIYRLMFFMILNSAFAQSVRIKDLTNIRGVRDNQLVGFGLVIGLNATGDSPASIATNAAVKNLLNKLGMMPPEETVTSASMAAVVVTANLPTFVVHGDKIDVQVASIGNAKSLAGGTLLMTPLKAGDGEVYVVAQGSIATSGAVGAGARVLTTARVLQGGMVEREFKPKLVHNGRILLSIKKPDFTTSMRIADRINFEFKGFFAKSLDPVSVEVEVPSHYEDRLTEYISEMEALTVEIDQKAVVLINERTGTVVMGGDVKLSPVALSHGMLSIDIGDGKKGSVSSPATETSVGAFVETLNGLGVTPTDLIAILQSLHAAGALQAELKML